MMIDAIVGMAGAMRLPAANGAATIGGGAGGEGGVARRCTYGGGGSRGGEGSVVSFAALGAVSCNGRVEGAGVVRAEWSSCVAAALAAWSVLTGSAVGRWPQPASITSKAINTLRHRVFVFIASVLLRVWKMKRSANGKGVEPVPTETRRTVAVAWRPYARPFGTT
jgi:hypothetical protein